MFECEIYTDIPQLVSAQLSDSTTNILVVFSKATNMPVASEGCGGLLTQDVVDTLGDGPQCMWQDASTLAVYLGLGATITPGFNLTVSGDIIQPADGSSDFMPPSRAEVLLPSVVPVVAASLVAPTAVGLCEALVLDTGASAGGAGRPLILHWFVNQANNPGLNETTLLALNTTLGDKGSVTVLTLSPAELPEAAGVVVLEVEISNWLLSRDVASVSVTRELTSVPTVWLSSPSLSVRAFEELSVQCSSLPPRCDDDTATTTSTGSDASDDVSAMDWSLVYTWTQVSGPAFLSSSSSNDAGGAIDLTSSRLFLPAYTLLPGEEYIFTVQAWYTDDASGIVANNSAVLEIQVPEAELVATVTPGSSRLSVTQPSFLLSAAGSYDPDHNAAEGPDDGLSYLWSCERHRALGSDNEDGDVETSTESETETQVEVPSCWTGENSDLNLTSSELLYHTPVDGTLDLDELDFTVVVSKGFRATSAQVSFSFALTDLPHVSIVAHSPSLDLYHKHNPQDILTLQSTVEGYTRLSLC